MVVIAPPALPHSTVLSVQDVPGTCAKPRISGPGLSSERLQSRRGDRPWPWKQARVRDGGLSGHHNAQNRGPGSKDESCVSKDLETF